MELVRIIKDKIRSAEELSTKYEPEFVDVSPLMENVKKDEDVDLNIFPTPKWFENDGGRYIGTADCVITKDREGTWVNVGTYRVMIHDKNTLGILIEGPRHGRVHMNSYFEKEEPCPVAISFGHHPAIYLFAALEVPRGISEYNYAGAILGRPYRVIKGPVTGLPIPADSEIAIEGYIYNETKDEGPYGEFMGYYSMGVQQSPIIRVEALYYRNNPIILGTCSGKPPHDYSYLRCPFRSAMIWESLERAEVPNVKGVWTHEVGTSRLFMVVSIKQEYAGHAKQAGYIASQCGQGIWGNKLTVVVDEDIDPTNLDEVIWAICTRSDLEKDIEIISGSVGTIIEPLADPESITDLREYSSAKAIIVATKPFRKLLRGKFPLTVEPDSQLKEVVKSKFPEIFT
jgi:UbiD family decarboxylase